ncbi:MAG: Zn-dependent hydrolase [Planctomycetota bacterium]
MDRCDRIAEITETPGEITRTYLTPAIAQTHEYLRGQMNRSGLDVRVDATGNLIGRLRTTAETNRVLLLGSHLDTVPNAGRYDGLLGALIGLAVVELIGKHQLPFHLDVVGLSEEEGVRFSKPYLGSAGLIGRFDPQWLDRKDQHGITMRQAIKAFGLQPDQIGEAAYDVDDVIGFIEPHIEQGPLLMRVGRPVGRVGAIAGQSRLLVRLDGEPGHAGTVPMPFRRDALVMAARWIEHVSQYALQRDGLCATVGQVHAHPNVRNVIPGRVDLSLDVRDADDQRRMTAVDELIARAREIAAAAEGQFHVLDHQQQPASRMDEDLSSRLVGAMAAKGVHAIDLTSGAGHDAAVLSTRFPTAMLFIRQPRGISHHPDEDVTADDVGVAIAVLHHLVMSLAESNTLS